VGGHLNPGPAWVPYTDAERAEAESLSA
jgi:hypothetical protein